MRCKVTGPIYSPRTEFLDGMIVALIMIVIIIILNYISPIGGLIDTLETIGIVLLVIALIEIGIYILLKKKGYYKPDRYEVAVEDDKIFVKVNKMVTLSGDNIEHIEIKRNVLIVKPKSYDYFIENSDGMERHNYYYAQEHNMPITLPLPALSRAERKRLKEAIEEFKRRNGIK